MGIFNKHSSNQHPFAKGLQGAPGVGFNLTSDGNYDMVGKKLTNVGNPTYDKDAVSKKYVDDNSGGKTSLITVDSNIDMKSQYSITKLKTPTNNDDAANKKYVDDSKVDGSVFLKLDGTRPMTGDANMNNKKIKNLSSPTANSDAANKKYVDDSKVDGSVFLKLDGTRAMTGDVNMNNKKIKNLSSPTVNGDAANKKYVDDSKIDGSVFFKLDGTRVMTGNLNMNNNRIYNIPNPTGSKQPIPLAYGDLAYLHVNGTNMMTNHMNMNNKKIINLQAPTNNTDAATKKYVDDKSTNPQDLSPFLKKDGSDSMTGNLNMIGHKIINLEDPVSDNDAVNKIYMIKHLHQTQVQPSHYKDEFVYLVSSPTQWTDEIDTRTSFIPKKIADLSTKKGNFHDYNHKVLYTTILKNFQGGYNYKMGLNFYRLVGGADYTLCLEILNTDYQLWHKTQISVDDNTSQGLQLGNVSVKKLQHQFVDSKSQTQSMYYHRVIINFKKLTTGNRFFIHILVNIPQNGNDLSVYPIQFSGVYIIAYGIMSKVSNIDPDKVYDYHTAFEIKPTEVKYNVDINANNKRILNIALDKNNIASAATVAMVKEIIPFTTNYVYRRYFEEFYDFTDANNYGLNTSSSGVVFNSLLPNITFPNKNLSDILKDGLYIKNYTINFNPSSNFTNYTLCLFFYYWYDSDFALAKKNSQDNQGLVSLTFTKAAEYLTLLSNNKRDFFNLPRPAKKLQPPSLIPSSDTQKTVLWLTESVDSIVTKAKINYSSATLTLSTSNHSTSQDFDFTIGDAVLSKIMFSPNFYDFDSEAFHRVMLQEKINRTEII